jgi:hypothetical protein
VIYQETMSIKSFKTDEALKGLIESISLHISVFIFYSHYLILSQAYTPLLERLRFPPRPVILRDSDITILFGCLVDDRRGRLLKMLYFGLRFYAALYWS